ATLCRWYPPREHSTHLCSFPRGYVAKPASGRPRWRTALVRQTVTLSAMAGAATPEKVRVVVGDDHPLFREGVVRALALSGLVNVVGEADDGTQALELIKKHRPDVALLDFRMPGMDGAQVAAAVRSNELPTRVLLLSAHDESAIVYQALQQGAAGFLLKDSTRSEIVKAVLDCASGRDVVAPSLAGGLAAQIRQRAEPTAPVLSAREREVLNGIARGQSIPTIAAELFVAPSTVKTHVQRLYEKLGVSDRAAAVAEAMRQGVLN
ncbi:MAG: two-component system, NarL family, nitrate/nitrite response regulator NarL, partial [Blastocatellia bacterium]|nr:two-component system, NarL family, nitrate/nitrite response regulator NarL [Blastocatellia bacterium]